MSKTNCLKKQCSNNKLYIKKKKKKQPCPRHWQKDNSTINIEN